MKIADFDFDLPEGRIALEPARPRSAARLMVYHRQAQDLRHSRFADLPEYLRAGDILVLNESRVLPARFFAQKKTGGNIEGLFIQALDECRSLVWLKGRVSKGDGLQVPGFGTLQVEEREDKSAVLSGEGFQAYLEKSGSFPLPPYIIGERNRLDVSPERPEDFEDYQTEYATQNPKAYSVASPTAGLHLDFELLKNLEERGVEIRKLELRVGAGTFAPVEAENLDEHHMHRESVSMPENLLEELQEKRVRGQRVIAMGTTSMRALEAAARVQKNEFETDLFIKPPFEFKVVDGLITNFHWPKSTLLVLVASFLEAEKNLCDTLRTHRWRDLYRTAIEKNYRFYSYGDGVLIL